MADWRSLYSWLSRVKEIYYCSQPLWSIKTHLDASLFHDSIPRSAPASLDFRDTKGSRLLKRTRSSHQVQRDSSEHQVKSSTIVHISLCRKSWPPNEPIVVFYTSGLTHVSLLKISSISSNQSPHFHHDTAVFPFPQTAECCPCHTSIVQCRDECHMAGTDSMALTNQCVTAGAGGTSKKNDLKGGCFETWWGSYPTWCATVILGVLFQPTELESSSNTFHQQTL